MTDLENTEVIEADDADEAQTEATTKRKRAPKRSKIADDYDPTPQRYPLSDEEARPELCCWVDESIAHVIEIVRAAAELADEQQRETIDALETMLRCLLARDDIGLFLGCASAHQQFCRDFFQNNPDPAQWTSSSTIADLDH